MPKLTDVQLKECKRDFKVLGVSSVIYRLIVGILSAAFSFASVSYYVAPIFFACMYLVDRKL